jgi:hypothetical protein
MLPRYRVLCWANLNFIRFSSYSCASLAGRAGPGVKTGTILLDERAKREAHRALFKIFFQPQNFI